MHGGWIWLLKTAASCILVTASAGATVWIVGDRLLTHSLSGFQTTFSQMTSSVEGLRSDLNGLRNEIRSVDDNSVNHLLEAIEDASEIKKEVASNYKELSASISNIDRQIERLIDAGSQFSQGLSDIKADTAANAKLLDMIYRGK